MILKRRPLFQKGGQVDQHLEDFVSAGNFKQALSLCEKRLKKSPSFEEDSVAKCHVLLLHPDAGKQTQGEELLQIIINHDPPFRNTFALVALVEFAYFRRKYTAAVDGLWAKALKNYNADEAWFEAWYKMYMALHRWTQASQAATRYMQQYKESHHAYFLGILARFLDFSHPYDDKSSLSGQIAFSLSAMAAKQARENPAGPGNKRSVKSKEDLFLVLAIYCSQHKCREAYELLDSKEIGIVSDVGQKDWELVRFKLQALKEMQDPTLQWTYSATILNDILLDILKDPSKNQVLGYGEMGDDWLVWDGLVNALKKGRSITGVERDAQETMLKNTKTLISSIQARRNSRNAALAAIEVSDTSGKGLFNSICDFVYQFCTKTACFRDLKPYLARLELTQRPRLLRYIAGCAQELRASIGETTNYMKWINAETTLLKIGYFFTMSKQDVDRSPDYYRSFIMTCLKLYKLSLSIRHDLPPSDRKPGDEVAILAALAIRQYAKAYEIEQNFKALILLEHLLRSSKHNYEALLHCVQTYLDIGASSLAMEYYSRLNVKNIQHGSMPWVIMTRISLLHPAPIQAMQLKRKPARIGDPLQEICAGLSWYESVQEILANEAGSTLEDRQYYAAFNTLTFKSALEHSYNRYLLFFEGERIARLCPHGRSQIAEFDNLLEAFDLAKVVDDRDTSPFPVCDHIPKHTVSGYGGGQMPFPGNIWLHMQRQQSRSWHYLTHENSKEGGDISYQAREDLRPEDVQGAGSLTHCEQWYFRETAASITLSMKSGKNDHMDELSRALGFVRFTQVSNMERLKANTIPLDMESHACRYLLVQKWHWFQDRYLFLDMCNFHRIAATKVLSDKAIERKHREASLLARKLCHEIEIHAEMIAEQALAVRQKLLEPRELAQIVKEVMNYPIMEEVDNKNIGDKDMPEDQIGTLLRELVGEEDIQQAAKDIIESWAEAFYSLNEVARNVAHPKRTASTK